MNEFQKILKSSLNNFYPGWRSTEHGYDLGVPAQDLRSWVDFGVEPEPEAFETFLNSAFPLTGVPKLNITTEDALQQREVLRIAYDHMPAQSTQSFTESDNELFGEAVLYHNSGLLKCWIHGDYEKALEDFHRAAAAYEILGDEISHNGVETDIATVYWCTGQFKKSEHLLTQSLARAQALQNDLTYMATTGNLGLLYLGMGFIEKADQYITRHLELARNAHHGPETARATGNRGILRLQQGRYQEAHDDLHADIKKSQVMNEGVVCALVNLSICYKHMNQPDKALATSMDALKIARYQHYVPMETIALRAAAECHPNPVQRVIYLCDALLLCQGIRLLDEAGCLLSLAGATNDPAMKSKFWNDAVKLLQANGADHWLKDRTPDNPPFLPLI